MNRFARSLVPLSTHTVFCVGTALLLRHATGGVGHAALVGMPILFLGVVVPILCFGWPPPFQYHMTALAQVGGRRLLLVSSGAPLVAWAVISALTFGSPVLGVLGDLAVFTAGAVLLYVAHKDGTRLRVTL